MKAAQIGERRIHTLKSRGAIIREKTATGWIYIGPVVRKARISKPYIGEVRKWNKGTFRFTENGWVRVPQKMGRPKGSKKSSTPSVKQSPAKSVIVARIEPETAKRAFFKATDKGAVNNGSNPAAIKIRKEEGKLVEVTGYPVRTWRLKKAS